MLSITALWKAEIEVFNCSFQILAWYRAVIHHCKHLCEMQRSRTSSHDKYLSSDSKAMTCTLYFMTNICEMQGRWQISHGRHKSLSAMAECDITRLPMATTPRKCILNKSWKQWLLLFCPFMCQCNASWSYWSIAVSCTRLKGKCPFSQPSATDLHLNASILTTSDQPCVPRTYFLNQIKSGQKKEFIKTSSWHTLRHTACEF